MNQVFVFILACGALCLKFYGLSGTHIMVSVVLNSGGLLHRMINKAADFERLRSNHFFHVDSSLTLHSSLNPSCDIKGVLIKCFIPGRETSHK